MKEADLFPLEKKYIEVSYSPVTQGYLREYCERNGFDLSIRFDGSKQDPEDFDFHSTIWFTTSEHRLKNGSFDVFVAAKAKNFALFGEQKNILVLEIESEGLNNIRDMYGREHKMTDQFPEYRPHVTVCYDWKGDIPDVPLPEEELYADRLNIKTQKTFKK